MVFTGEKTPGRSRLLREWFRRNMKIYEAKWGESVPHRYHTKRPRGDLSRQKTGKYLQESNCINE